ncbi:4Fe-4S binding protein [Pelosinus propionicus]|uniref:4Fe-4S binding domain-containing protein n=1 Tax=Pelosinus propionicus DSM 13327 TaxID=1123291 RepID=A0A1I4GPP6_9FIRM|nr:4Fe-4S binding protein [Pelosinus propionicus]SFL31450.1 4Fe-4S binding domain-containing protein [Pelosinus propionicus DSM 13327]
MNQREIKRILGYFAGLFLFFAPFAYYQKTLSVWLGGSQASDIHSFCLRIPLLNVLTGQSIEIFNVGIISLLLLVSAAFFLGPFFCAHLCASGALPEYLSRLMPKRFKIDWQRSVNPVPIRYGFFVGYLLSPFLAGSIACALCNYSFMERLIVGGVQGDIGPLGSTAIITAILWLGIFGVMAKGGRGFCSYLCPVGALQSAVHSVGARFRFTYKLRFIPSKCVNCKQCVKKCPMGALSHKDGILSYEVYNCITCGQCAGVCAKNALAYGTGESGWQKENAGEPELELVK